MNEFRATHEITLLLADGTSRTFDVQLARGEAHTRVEWLRGARSAWSFRDGRWRFHDRCSPPGCMTLAITPIAGAALERLAWELVDVRSGLRYDGRCLLFARDGAREPLRLEVVEDHLRLSDGTTALHVEVRAPASWVRELVEEWTRLR